MSEISSLCGINIEDKRVPSIFSEENCITQMDAKEDKLKSTKAEMGEVKEENERLKMMLENVEKDYHSLKLLFFDILNREAPNKGVEDSYTSPNEVEEPKFVSLCLGRTPKEPKKEDKTSNSSKPKENEDLEDNLKLGLELVSDHSPMNNSEEVKKAERGGTCSRNILVRTKDSVDEILEQIPTKRARVCVRARCDTPTMHDGCQWRKYGQKISKGNPCPRAYYRCTVAAACPVRKQVQRCAEDMSILITTYEGSHNHPLPVSATAMASTTSAAASMLLSGSSTSQPENRHNSAPFGNAPTLLNGLNFSHFDQPSVKQAFLPNPASQNLFPTITLDLTSSSKTTNFNRLSSTYTSTPRFHPLSLSFCPPEPNIIPSFWGKGVPNIGTMTVNKTHIRPVNIGNQFQEHIYHNCIKNQTPFNEALAETLTKAISTDPSLRSAIAAAVSSIGRQGSINAKQVGEEILGSGLSLRLGEHPQYPSSNHLNQNGKGCLAGYFNRSSSSPSSSSSKVGNFMLLQPPQPFSISKRSTLPSNVDPINHWIPEIGHMYSKTTL
ncbi:hypothetical protein TanjilG_04103 [Lupinus angustifolius]|uniref:WRKY domain-containing protein n=1 Tax=Lupinus angustifolius TaxID=3871 RepID=A0A4P1RBF6_LUPAN|nr:PREDICTED: probable WRKY transcription factor 72 [Lupinus angustifolius]OIW06709.1 hypothetical protein TanjilG_04103 [Lupinus angustifolius]